MRVEITAWFFNSVLPSIIRCESLCRSNAWRRSFLQFTSPTAFQAWEGDYFQSKIQQKWERGFFRKRNSLVFFPAKMFSKFLLLAKNGKNSHLTLFAIEGLPIKIFRFPINFKSEVEETSLLSGRKFFYHVVLGIAYKGKLKNKYFSGTYVYLKLNSCCKCCCSLKRWYQISNWICL